MNLAELSPSSTPEERLQALRQWMRALGSGLICYSGGIDSALVLAVANEQLGAQAVGMTAVSASLAESEKLGAQQTAQEMGATHRFVNSGELARPGYVQNGPDRCYHCKTELYELAEQKRQEWKLSAILNGTNIDDLGDYRPGLAAAVNAAVRSPLVELKFTKQDVRDVSKLLGLKIWSKPASACLSSRIPYGTAVTPGRLQQVASLEEGLKRLGFQQVRVRYHGDIARIEILLEDLPRLCEDPVRSTILEAGKQAGFTYVTFDLGGYRQGSHNELLSARSLKLAR